MSWASGNPLRTPLSKARGLGSAHDGTHHWWMQRITSIALIPLSLWFVYSLLTLAQTADSSVVMEWFDSAFNALFAAIFVATTFYHSRLGLQVVIEDYVHGGVMRMFLLLANQFIHIAAAILAVMAIGVMHFGEAVMVD